MLKELKITKFKGIKDASYDRFGLVNVIHGKNGSGKTSVLDCILWLITGATLTYGSGKIDDKCIDENNPNELINAKIVIDDYELERIYGHKLDDEGNVIDVNYYYANGRKCKNQKDYYDYIDNVFNMRAVKSKEKINLYYALINPLVLGKEIDQNVFRRFIQEIIGINFESKVMELDTQNKYGLIKDEFKRQAYDINKLISYYKQSLKTHELAIAKYSNEIKQELSCINAEELAKKYDELSKEKISLSSESLAYKPSEECLKLYNRKRQLDSEIALSLNQDKFDCTNSKENDLLSEITSLKNDYNSKIDKYYALNNKVKNDEWAVKGYQLDIANHEKNIERINAEDITKIQCPHCGEIVNDIEVGEFQKTKKEKIEKENKAICSLSSKIIEYTDLIEKGKKEVSDYGKQLNQMKKNIEEKRLELDELKKKPVKVVESQKTLALKEEFNKVDAEFNEKCESEKKAFEIRRNEVNVRLAEIEKELSSLMDTKKMVSANDIVVGLKKKEIEEKSKAESYLSLSKDLALDVAKLTNEYSKKIFGNDVDFVMTKKLKTSDEYKSVCYAQVNGISYDSLNTANCLLTGIIVAQKIKTYLGIKNMPIIFDIVDNIGKEILGNIINACDSQVFYTSVDREDKEERKLIVLDKGE